MKARQVCGDILIALVIAFTVYLSVIMIRRIQTVVLKDNYIKKHVLICLVLQLLY